MPDLRRVSLVAILLLIVLRLSIGWQFLYEGLWKFDSMDSAKPWSAAGYLKNSVGPFRSTFRGMVEDPDDLKWLDYEQVSGNWETWREEFTDHYELTDEQKASLAYLMDGPEEFTQPLAGLPSGMKPELIGKALHYDAQRKLLVIDGDHHMIPKERDNLVNSVKKRGTAQREALDALKELESPSDDEKAKITRYESDLNLLKQFGGSMVRVYAKNTQLSYNKKLKALLRGDADLVTLVNDEEEGTVDHKRMGEIDQYKALLAQYEERVTAADQDFEYEHLEYLFKKIKELHTKTVVPVKSLDTELKQSALKLLTTEQIAKGPLEKKPNKNVRISKITMWSLTILGAMLILGLGTRVAALAGAGMLLSFYLVAPPWPGVPQLPSPDHSLFVNKNLIEVFALLAMVVLPSGSWFGLDGVISSVRQKRKFKKAANQQANLKKAAEKGKADKSDKKKKGKS